MLLQKSDFSNMITQKRKTGDNGEELACVFLRKNGYSIVERNYPCKFGEIDIIAKKGITLHYIEVKTSKKGSLLTPEENITSSKLRKFIKTIDVYRVAKNIRADIAWQIDAIIVRLDDAKNTSEIIYIENINIQ